MEVRPQPCCSSKYLEVRDIRHLVPIHALGIPQRTYSFLEYSRLDNEPVEDNFVHQQSSPASVAYVLLGGFIFVVSDLRPMLLGTHLIASKYSFLSFGIKQKVR